MILNGNNITKEYTRRGEKFPAVNNADFFAWSGDYTVIFGESGSGKSTLLNALAGISAPTSGSIAIDGQPLYTLNDEDRSKLRNERIGYIPQNAACLPAFTVTENIELAASLYKHRIDKEQIQSLLKNSASLIWQTNTPPTYQVENCAESPSHVLLSTIPI